MGLSGVENAKQYGDVRKIAARARLHSRYTIAEIGWFEWVAQNLPLATGAKILDVGCGPGWFWTSGGPLPDRLDLTLVDRSGAMVGDALERCHDLPLAALRGETADAVALPFAEGQFDGVIAMHMLYHVEAPQRAIAEMARVLKPGGFLAVTTNGANNLRALYELTRVLGAAPLDPAAAIFGFKEADEMMRQTFGTVSILRHPARLRVTDPEDVFLAMTSFPPGEDASSDTLEAFRAAIAEAFERGGGAVEAEQERALFLARKAG
ncbi:class I SAM-dependent methyltransferase [Rhizobium sp. SSA_523]|uniref:class I SAM-dependent methyltransferase n=1 Tax=Rhizobium sp. SSA_523 TaxID=2952477 RepID=UPI0020905D89|nr:class I SAM-dependent methyltransferase [Rhizobium sp. SSA_523]MCO5730012.1 class I SAM-dependent methyltransferase [Rhizobium sp. SSA_523]WKC25084.1 class I SAM-dependent methyltransferase [Rhizobium sp. SSA_523]